MSLSGISWLPPRVRTRWRACCSAFGFVLMLLSAVTEATAWQLPTRHALRRSAEALRLPAGLDAFEVTLFGKARVGAGEETAPVGVRWSFARSAHRAAATFAWQGRSSLSWVRGDTRPPRADGPTAAEAIVLPRLLADADPATLAQQLGVDGERHHLALLGDSVADVLGAASAAERDVPQLWLDHARWYPLRVVFRVQAGASPGPLTRIDLLDWDTGPSGIPCPRRIVVHEGGRWVRTYELEPARPAQPSQPSRSVQP